MNPKPGDVIAEKYEILRTIGQGGMGAVVAARHRELGHSVALKFVKPEALALPGVRDRFEREARAAVMLKSQHVARVFDVFTAPEPRPSLLGCPSVGVERTRCDVPNSGRPAAP